MGVALLDALTAVRSVLIQGYVGFRGTAWEEEQEGRTVWILEPYTCFIPWVETVPGRI